MNINSKNKAYSIDGVNVEEEASFSSFAGSICKASYNNSPFVEVHDLSGGSFRGPRPFTLKNLPEGYFIEASADGIGTKGIIIDAAKTHHQAAYDIIAMTASDITRFGGIPLVFINILDTSTVGNAGDETSKAYKGLMSGLGEVVKNEKIVVLKGETAQMGVALGSEISDSKTKLNWSGVMIGAYHKDKMITGDTLANGQVIIALKENGFRCNGISSLRAALREKYGTEWWKNPEAQEDIKSAATPSVLYDTFINTLHGWYNKDFKSEMDIHAVVHLSGGAFSEKLAKDILFPRGLSAMLTNLFDPPEIMRKCAEWRKIDDEEFYEVWNGGQGMLLVVNENDAERCVKMASDFGITANIAGTITKEERPIVTIISKLNDKKIVYEHRGN
ncbi:MAG TPA: AIR synthase-related protein [Candidatus Paceibacterota bacterium]|nr:AIR synthase-related protein [Candidatus Paceibacterota bacterium]